MSNSQCVREQRPYELCFRPLFDNRQGYAFPCDAAGHVDIDALSFKARQNYFFARTVIGRELSMPAVQPSTLN
jgi:hypothetical protein